MVSTYFVLRFHKLALFSMKAAIVASQVNAHKLERAGADNRGYESDIEWLGED
jgi:hypothetical protein